MRLSNRQKAHVNLAYVIAKLSEAPNRHGCLIASKSGIISSGFNKDKTHPAAVSRHSNKIHAEFAAIIASNASDLSGADMFIVRAMRDGKESYGMSRPCEGCMSLILKAEIKRIFFSDRDGNIQMEKL